MEEMLTSLRAIVGRGDEGEDALLGVLLSQARAAVLGITGRTELPEGLKGAVVDLAVLRYNRRGMEGETQRTEGGVTAQMEALPEDIRRQLRRYTLAKAGVERCANG